MNLSSFIARRYLVAKKSHNVINIISIISAAGIAVGCAALVVILSIYNGFDSIVRSLFNSYTPDLIITPAQGKTFSPAGDFFDTIRKDERVAYFCEVLEENVFLKYNDQNVIATAKGVDSLYAAATSVKDYVVEGSFELMQGDVSQVVIGRTLAADLGLRTRFLTPLEVYFPSRTSEISLVDPLSSLRKETLFPGGIVSIEQSFDSKYLYMPILSLRSLLEYTDEVTAVELYLKNEAELKGMQRDIEDLVGSDGRFVVKNKQQQNDSLNRLLVYEKMAIYLILLFVILIISCNILNSLTMLKIEKKGDVEILKSMGATPALIKSIFVKEGRLISLCGIVTGIAVGLLICFIQAKFGIVKMPGNFIISAYPVVVQWWDIVITFFGVGAISYFVAKLVR